MYKVFPFPSFNVDSFFTLFLLSFLHLLRGFPPRPLAPSLGLLQSDGTCLQFGSISKLYMIPGAGLVLAAGFY
jgi:hypothetical protein